MFGSTHTWLSLLHKVFTNVAPVFLQFFFSLRSFLEWLDMFDTKKKQSICDCRHVCFFEELS